MSPTTAQNLFELFGYAWLIILLVVYARRGRSVLGLVLVAIVYSLVLEAYDILATRSYYYDRFLVMIGSRPTWVPLAIGTAWAVILLVCRSTAEALRIRRSWQPLVVGMLATTLDFAVDPVMAKSRLITELRVLCDGPGFLPGDAVGIGAWTWCVDEKLEHTWYGVPFGNFFGWFALVAVFTYVASWVERRAAGGGEARSTGAIQLRPGDLARLLLFATAAGWLILTAYELLVYVGVPDYLPVLVALLLGLFGLTRSDPTEPPPVAPGWLILTYPISAYLFLLVAYLTTGVSTRSPGLLWPLIVVAAVGSLLFALPLLLRRGDDGRRGERRAPAEPR